jgi:quercetin dioxygenase-like cupin family protein
MNDVARFGARLILAVLALGGASACTRQESAAEEAEIPDVVALAAEYEAAMAAQAMKPIIRPSGTAPALWGPGDLYSLLLTGEESNGALLQFEAIVPTGGGPPPHIHGREDETFYVVKGELDVRIGDATHHARAGDFVFVPRGTVHAFRNVGSDTAIQLVTVAPAGLEQYFREVFPVATDRNAAPPPVTEDFIQKLREAGPRYGLEFVPPSGGGSH